MPVGGLPDRGDGFNMRVVLTQQHLKRIGCDALSRTDDS
jgi:hypothetical protein